MTLEELTVFVRVLVNGDVKLSSSEVQMVGKPQVVVPVDLKAEQGDQKTLMQDIHHEN